MHLRNLLLVLPIATSTSLFAQKPNWQNLDLKEDTVFGMSTEKAYRELLPGKKASPVIVAVLDSGIDTLHEDLMPSLWTNKKGWHGWDFIGPETGLEDITRLSQSRPELVPVLEGKIRYMHATIDKLEKSKATAESIIQKIGKNEPDLTDFNSYKPLNKDEQELIGIIRERLPFYPDWKQCEFYGIDHLIALLKYHLQHGLNKNNDEADTAKGDPDISPDALELAPDANETPLHGTHVAGIIAAARNNGKGINGVADHAQIMMLKVNGNMRELRDRSLAQAIRFAVDNGASVINISMGKGYTWDKKDVDDAVRYAGKKDVLIIHAAGNEGLNTDQAIFYPNPEFADGAGKADNWITVGASRPYDDTVMIAAFSNYGKRSVDVFAPGTGINSSIPGGNYVSWSGTSMAAPMVAGLAALIREYYPILTARQVKEIILRSVIKVDHPVYVLDNDKHLQKIPFSETCSSGGVVNAYNALKLAAMY